MKTPKTPLGKILDKLHKELKKKYGCDFAYTVLGNGKVIGASNAKDGHINSAS